ncbi:MAG: hypothetical protein ACI9C1_002429 [Candidatus Aldehydirespiratoraceae bacterium]|jgi:hypothetical protein
MPNYGTPNTDYFARWFSEEDDFPVWALNLMRYHEVAQYTDGRETTISGREADDVYAPHGPLAAVGARVVVVADVEHHLVGNGITWDRIAIAQYPARKAMAEMNMRDDFKDAHDHKEAGMAETIVMFSVPTADSPVPAEDLDTAGRRLLLQVNANPDAPDLADSVESTRLAEFTVDGVVLGDGRSWARVLWDIVDDDAVDALVTAHADAPATDGEYALIIRSAQDLLPESLRQHAAGTYPA